MRRLVACGHQSILMLMVSALGLLAASAQAATLPVPAVSQVTPVQYDNWCWAAVSQAVLSYTGNAPADKCVIADWARQQNGWGADDCCTNGTGAICNQPNGLYGAGGSIEAILSHWGADSRRETGALTLKKLQDAIDDDSPVIVRWGWTAGGGHFVVAHGYTGSKIDVMDPWNGPTQLMHADLIFTADRKWTHTLVVVPKKVTYVVDDTGSMSNEINSVRNTLLNQVAGYTSSGRFVKYTLVTYKDAPTFVGSTIDHAEITTWLQALAATGGGDCPEEGYGALDLVAEKAPHSDVRWMTDADSHGGFLRMLQTRLRLVLAGNTLHSTILGSCTASTATASRQDDSKAYDGSVVRGAGADVDAFTAGEALSTATGGLYFAVNSASIDEATQMIVEEISSTALVRRLRLSSGSHFTSVPVDASVSALKVLLDVSVGATGSLTVTAPGGGELTPGSPGVSEIVAGASRMLLIVPPALVPGNYAVNTSSSAQHVLSLSADTSHGVSLVGDSTAATGQPFAVALSVPSVTPLTGPAGPGPDGPGGALPELNAPEPDLPFDPDELVFFVESEDGTGRHTLQFFDDGLHGDGVPGDGIYGGTIVFASSGLYRLGIASSEGSFERVAEELVSAGAVDVTAPADQAAHPGESVTYTFVVENLSPDSRTFDLAVDTSVGWSGPGTIPASVTIATGATATVSITVVVPAGATSGDAGSVLLVAAAQDDPTVTDADFAVTTAWTGPLLSSLEPGSVVPGQMLVLAGSGFGTDPGTGNRGTDTHHVSLAGVRVADADVSSWSDTAVIVRVPAGTTSGLVHLVASGVASNDLTLILTTSSLVPGLAFRNPGTPHSVVLTVLGGGGAPAAGVSVSFQVVSGPNTGASGVLATDANGQATFSYTGTGGVGVDEIRASFIDPSTGNPSEATVLAFWDADCNANGLPDTCEVGCAGFGGQCGAISTCGSNPGLACLGSSVTIPTISELGLMVLGLALALLGLLKLRS